MPGRIAEIARNDLAPLPTRLAAAVAQDSVVFVVLELEIVGKFFITRPCSAVWSATLRLCLVNLDILVVGFCITDILVLALFARLHTFEVIPYLEGKIKSNNIFHVELNEKLGEDTTIWPRLGSPCVLASMTEPFALGRLAVVHRRINTGEVESAPTPITTK